MSNKTKQYYITVESEEGEFLNNTKKYTYVLYNSDIERINKLELDLAKRMKFLTSLGGSLRTFYLL